VIWKVEAVKKTKAHYCGKNKEDSTNYINILRYCEYERNKQQKEKETINIKTLLLEMNKERSTHLCKGKWFG
jgi:hypothetical protein